MENETLPRPKLRDLIIALKNRKRDEEALFYGVTIPTLLEIALDIPYETAMEQSIDNIIELLKLPPKPLKYKGWSFFWGVKAFGRDHG